MFRQLESTQFMDVPANAGDTGDERDVGSIPGSERSTRRGNGNPLQYSCLKNSMGRGSWWATVHGVAELDKKLFGGKPATYLHPLQCFECDRWHLF